MILIEPWFSVLLREVLCRDMVVIFLDVLTGVCGKSSVVYPAILCDYASMSLLILCCSLVLSTYRFKWSGLIFDSCLLYSLYWVFVSLV